MKNKLPKIEFTCSRIYHKNWEEWVKLLPNKKNTPYPEWEEVFRYAKKIEPKWRKVEVKILVELTKITGLTWRDKTIKCYLVGRCRPFSDPLTLHISYKSDTQFIDVLAHELIHQLFIQNYSKTKKAWDYLRKHYEEESITTRNHIFLHAIHRALFLELFGEKRLREEITWSNNFPDYKRSWDIVKKEGAENLIDLFKSLVKK